MLAVLTPCRGAPAADADTRAGALLARMTQAEKLAMLHGVFAAFPDQRRPARALGSAGFVPGVPRLNIPDLQETDAGLGIANPNGVRPGDTAIALPSGLAVAASFDPAAAYDNGAALGRQARQHGFNVVLGGGANLVRDPRGGRSFEYAGEDPLLAGVMVGAAARGTQDQHVIATVKHFALNDQETGRMVLSANLPDAAMRESDLLAFEIAVEQGHPGAVMCAYNRVNGVYACENPDLLTVALKQDWHYPGWVMSDWGAVHSVGAINAGLDQESGEQFDARVYFAEALADAIRAGHVTQARIDDAVRRILRSMIAAGLMDTVIPKPDAEADFRAARRAATEGIVLLVNRDLLPLPRTLRRVCVIGGQADAGVPAGGGSSQVTPTGGAARAVPHDISVQPKSFATQIFDPPSPLSRIRAMLPDADVAFDDGNDPARAASRARACDTALIFAMQFAGEGFDLPGLTLPGDQDTLIQVVAAANPRTAVILETSGPVAMPWRNRVGAVLEAWYPGSAGADAIADILFGVQPPSGRLPVTFPASVTDLPNRVVLGANLPDGHAFSVTYQEGADAGYRWFARTGKAPLFPFGFGLSTTQFMDTHLHVTGGRMLRAEFDLTNTGPRDGVGVPQFYLLARGGVPTKRLLGFSRQALRQGETRHMSILADLRLIAHFDSQQKRWIVPEGPVSVEISDDAGGLLAVGQSWLAAQTLPP